MSEFTTGTPESVPPGPPAPQEPTADASLVARVSALETRVGALEVHAPTVTAGTPTSPRESFDADARLKELRAQGVEENAAVEQAAYEERLWNDQHPTA